jgi:6-phosphogluconate dehydrogenase
LQADRHGYHFIRHGKNREKGQVEKNEDWRKHLIWKHDMTTGDLITEPLETRWGTEVMHVMSGTQTVDKDMLGPRTLILIVKADDTIQDVIKQVQAMLCGPDFLLTHCEKLLRETTTVADCQIESYDVLVSTACLITFS